MNARSWLVLMGSVSTLGCGHRGSKAKGDEAGSGSGTSSPWKFVGFVDAPHHQLAVVTTGTDAALVDATGKRTPSIKVDSDQIVAKGNGELVLLSVGDAFHGLDASGHEIWTQTLPPGQASFGASTFATATTKDSSVVALATGKAVYSGKAAAKLAYHPHDGYVFGDAAEMWFVDEATGTERWRQKLDGLADATPVLGPTSVFVTRPDRTFVELDVATGKQVSKGTCDGKPPGADDHPKDAGCAGYPKVDLGKDDISEVMKDPRGGDYYGQDKAHKGTSLVARDPVGRIRWTTPAPLDLRALKGPFVAENDAKLAVFIGGTQNDRVLVVFDDTDGKLLFQHKLADGERLLGSAGPCWLIINDRHAACVDARAGNPIWNVVTSGDKVEAWPLHGGEALLADGNPVTLSRVGKDGHRVWQTELPGTQLDHPTDPDRTTAPFMDNKPWELSDTLAIVEAKDGLTVIDLATGKLAKVH